MLIQYSVLKNIWEKKIPKYTLMEDIKSEEITKKKKRVSNVILISRGGEEKEDLYLDKSHIA